MIFKFEPHGFVVFLTFSMGMVYAVFNSRSSWGFWKVALVGLFVLPFLYYGFMIGRVVEVVAGSLIGYVYARHGRSLNPFSDLTQALETRRMIREIKKAYEKAQREQAKADNKTHTHSSSRNPEEEVKRRQRQAQEERGKHRGQSESEQASETEEPRADYSNSSWEQPGSDTKQDVAQLNPTNLDDAFKILGLEKGSSLSDCKQAYRTLISIYNSDKISRLSGYRKSQAEEEAKDINRAWATIKKYYDARK